MQSRSSAHIVLHFEYYGGHQNRIIAASAIAFTTVAGGAVAAQLGAVGHAVEQAGEATKDAAKATGTAAADATKKGAEKTRDVVTGKPEATCVDKTHHIGKTQAAANAACAKHGGVGK